MELIYLRKLAVEEGAAKTTEAIDRLLANRERRLERMAGTRMGGRPGTGMRGPASGIDRERIRKQMEEMIRKRQLDRKRATIPDPNTGGANE